ncbi:DUF4139 domain-containing protein [Nitrincola tapanii]|uniref:DUF4139 domain-containing protein n=1 Tax=Nitrincola tapanii TaxID=1708751 RepID=A0A5A9W0V6_9GAMM|nr:hypothetical protein [Nitrincola tapanii]KAA0874124.1 hypothetical protein E1H14_10125 [Nitrincola tapanii]
MYSLTLAPGFRGFLSKALPLSLICLAAQAQALTLSSQGQSLTLTLYNQDLALIQDQRPLPKLPANTQVWLEGVSPQLQAETLRIQGAGQLLEQSLVFNPLNYSNLLEAHLGKTLELARLNPVSGQETQRQVELLSLEGQQALVRENNQIESIPLNTGAWRFIFKDIPQHLSPQPQLSFTSAGTSEAGQASFSYLTSGLGWSMDYVLSLSAKGDSLAVEGLASLYNQTGLDIEKAQVRLMAGDIQRPQPGPEMMLRAAAMSADALGSAAVEPSSIQDYYLYRLPQTLSLRHQERKQLPLIQHSALPAQVLYQHEFHLGPYQDAQRHRAQPDILLSFKAPKLPQSNSPMPAGQARVFRTDTQGELQFIGGGHLPNLASGEEARLQLGKAMDLNLTRRQTLFSDGFDAVITEHEITLNNSGTEGRRVDLSALFGQEWSLQKSSHPMQMDESGRLRASMTVPAGGSEILKFSVSMKKRINR